MKRREQSSSGRAVRSLAYDLLIASGIHAASC